MNNEGREMCHFVLAAEGEETLLRTQTFKLISQIADFLKISRGACLADYSPDFSVKAGNDVL